MKRLAFLASLFGFGAAAQEFGPPRLGFPPNGECPVCHTMADAYHPRKTHCCGGPPNTTNMGIAMACIPEEPSCDPDTRLVRCKRCSAAFYQDAE